MQFAPNSRHSTASSTCCGSSARATCTLLYLTSSDLSVLPFPPFPLPPLTHQQTDNYYTSFDSVCKHRKGKVGSVTAFCDAVKTAGLEGALKGAEATLFVPNDAAFTKATKDAKPSKEALAGILKYHVVDGECLCQVLPVVRGIRGSTEGL
jgi:hypothetical protein